MKEGSIDDKYKESLYKRVFVQDERRVFISSTSPGAIEYPKERYYKVQSVQEDH